MLRGILMATVLPLAAVRAQSPPSETPHELRPTVARVDSLYFAARLDEALALCDSVFATGVDNAGLRWRCARSAVAAGMLRPAERVALYDRALAHARSGFALAPTDLTARYWVAVSAGRRTRQQDPAYSARLAREIHEHVTVILAADSMHAGAHHVLGMLHAEILRVPRLLRFIGARVLRADLVKLAKWEEAELHLRRAVELEPEVIIFLADLEALYARAGRRQEATDLADRIMVAPALHPMDESLRDRIRATRSSAGRR